MDIVYLVYGLAFLALGLVLLVWPKQDSRYELANLSRWLAWFGLLHGLLEWLDLWRVVHGDNPFLESARPLVLLVSYLLLFEFGRRLMLASLPARPRPVALDGRVHLPLIAIVAAASLAAEDAPLYLTIWSRYVFGFTGSLLTGAALLLYYRHRIRPNLPAQDSASIRHASHLASTAFIAYGVLGGLIVPRADAGLAAWLNKDVFLAVVGVPVEVFRATCAVLIAYSVSRILRVFHLESGVALRNALRQADLALTERNSLARHNQLLLDAAGEGIYGVDYQGNITFINPAALVMLDLDEAESLGRNAHELFHHHRADGGEYPCAECPLNLTLKDGIRREVEDFFFRKDGERFPVRIVATPMIDNAEQVGAEVVFQDISRQKMLEAELTRLATTDELTGLANRRHFLEQMDMELSRIHRFSEPAALLMLDLDHFKRINDTHGHAWGDATLRAFAKILLRHLRKTDLAGRLGGEEFALLLPGTGLESARCFAEELRRRVSGMTLEIGQRAVKITVSIGIARLDRDDVLTDAALARADAALYRAKESGRDRVELQSERPGAGPADRTQESKRCCQALG
jgi:diguanylate cyclase (GGDEF)-like protein/PAS domain S-box-containing protein